MIVSNKLLGKETTDNNLELKVFYTPDVNGSYACSSFLRGYAEHASSGMIGHYVPLLTPSFKHPIHCIFAIVEDTEGKKNVAGFIAFNIRPALKQAWIELSYTPHKLRGKGIYPILYKYLEEQCLDLKLETISGYVHQNNASMIKAATKVGLEASFYKMSKRL